MQRSIWFGRVVLAAGTLLFVRIALEYIVDPAGAVARSGVTLGSPDALTSTRVSGGLFLGLAMAWTACIVSERRLLAGLAFFVTVATAILALRLVGLALDGPGPFTLMVLKPEIALVVASGIAFAVERRRRRAAGPQLTAPT
jgi:hypothetical protein